MSAPRGKFERWFIQGGLSFTFLMIYPMFFILGFGLSAAEELSVVMLLCLGVLSSGAAWGAGYYCSWRIAESEDAVLAPLTPFTAGLFYRKNASRIGLILFTLYVIIPLLTSAILVGFLYFEHDMRGLAPLFMIY